MKARLESLFDFDFLEPFFGSVGYKFGNSKLGNLNGIDIFFLVLNFIIANINFLDEFRLKIAQLTLSRYFIQSKAYLIPSNISKLSHSYIAFLKDIYVDSQLKFTQNVMKVERLWTEIFTVYLFN